MANLLVPSNKQRCIPLSSQGDRGAHAYSRLGGCAPKGVSPETIGPNTEYFATFRIADDPIREVTLFLNFDWGIFVECCGSMQFGTGLVYPILHSESVRGETTKLASHLSECDIYYQSETDDLIDGWEDGEQMPNRMCKLGGRPHLLPYNYQLLNQIENLEAQGFFQVLQIGFGLRQNDWPFADGFFHLLGKEPFDDSSWLYFWQK